MDCVTAASVVAASRQHAMPKVATTVPISTNSRWTELDQKVTMLEKRQANLVTALKSGREPRVERAVRVLKTPLVEAVDAMDQGILYEVPLKLSGKQIMVCVVSVFAIYCTMRTPAVCPYNVTWRLLQPRGPTAWDLHQLCRAIDALIGKNYTFPETKHLEENMRGGPLHLHTSVFGGCLILREVELPKMVEPPLRSRAVDEPALEKLEEDKPVRDETGDETQLPSSKQDENETNWRNWEENETKDKKYRIQPGSRSREENEKKLET